MHYQSAQLSLIGDRETNQDRMVLLDHPQSVIGFVADGMGGHAGGEKAAAEAIRLVEDEFNEIQGKISNPKKFLRKTVAAAHDAIVNIGSEIEVDSRPRATCAAFLLQAKKTFWVHVGDSRVYLFRHARVLSRTRDHTHVELLLQEGLISEEELADHPLRSFVDNCLGGDASTPNISISKPHTLEHGDIVLACSDGIWNGLDDRDIGRFFRTKRAQDLDLKTALDSLGEAALEATTPNADNTTAVAIQWLEQN